MTMPKSYLALLLICMLLAPLPAHAGATMMISSPSPGEFDLFGLQLDDIVAMQIVINYDVSTMSNASASATGILLAHSRVTSHITNGTIEVTATGSVPVGEYGNVVIVSFDPASDSTPGMINSASVYATDISGRQSSIPVVINNPQPKAPDPLSDASTSPGGGAAARPAESGTVAGAGETVLKTPADPGAGTEIPAPGGGASLGNYTVIEGSGLPAGPHQKEAFRVISCSSLLERVRKAGVSDYAGQLLPSVTGPDCTYRQEPGALLSDGNSTARIVMELDQKDDKAPNFFIKGAHCLSLKRSARAWELEFVPLTGVFEASVAALYDDRSVEFPLTVAPPIQEYRKKLALPTGAGVDAYVELVNSLVRNLSKGQP